MADQDYFGVRLGEALSSGAGHIAQGLQRRYEIQSREREKQEALQRREIERQEELRRQQELRDQSLSIQMGSQGIQYDPMNPAASFEQFSKTMGQRREQQMGREKLGDLRTMAQIQDLAGKQEAKEVVKKEAEQKKVMDLDEFIGTIDRAKEAINDTIKDVSWLTAGLLGVQAEKPSAWNMAANELAGKIQHIESIIGLKTIEKLKAQSRTGATGFGQLSEKELNLLTSNIANIKANLNRPDALRKNLEKVAEVLDTWKERSTQESSGAAPSVGSGLTDRQAKIQELRRKLGRE